MKTTRSLEDQVPRLSLLVNRYSECSRELKMRKHQIVFLEISGSTRVNFITFGY